MNFEPRHAFFLPGPTAIGKSEIAVHLASRLSGEIISVDSMQVYRGLDIGTAKPSLADRQRVPHHLIDVADLTEEFSAARFARLAAEVAGPIQQRGKVPVFCGGTGLYFNALLAGLGGSPPSDSGVRAALEALPLAELTRELSVRDPECFARIDQRNRRRLIRALEVARLTGRPFSEQRASWPALPEGYPIIGLSRDSSDLHRRIAIRVEAMFEAGLVEETRRLLAAGLESNRTAMQAIGYRQVVDYLRGVVTLRETVERVKAKTRQLAKRQMTWFRRQLPMTWLPLAPDSEPERVAEDLVGRFTRTRGST